MDASVAEPFPAGAFPRPDQAITVRRISFVDTPPAGAVVRREFRQPRLMVAVENAADLTRITGTPLEPRTDSLTLIIIASGPVSGSIPETMGWIAEPNHPEEEPGFSIELKNGTTVEWRPTRVTIRDIDQDTDELLPALIDFGFQENELRTLEKIVESREALAQEDVCRSFRISRRDREHWTRIGETIESLTRTRLTLARLEPMFSGASKTLSPLCRRLRRQLIARADVASRLETLSGRLEALEDLYEGANDRIADYQGWHRGHVMEIIIIIMLFIEILLMLGDMYLQYLRFD